jgi:uncharacterized integral membrane protein (TIGR00698 family)
MSIQDHKFIEIVKVSRFGPVVLSPKQPQLNFWLSVGLTAGIGVLATLLASLPGLSVVGSLTMALLLGIGWRTIVGLPKTYLNGVQFSAKKLLRFGIVLTGVRLNFSLIVSSGLPVLVLDMLLIVFGLTFIPWLARRFGLPPNLALLLGIGQSICGASAVGATASLLPNSSEDDASLAVAICGLLGTLGVLFYIISENLLRLPGRFYGLWSGSTLHEIAQVVAAGPAGGASAVDLAMVVKLTRVLLLVPVALLLTFVFTRWSKDARKQARLAASKLPFPWFILGFVVVGVFNSTGWFNKDFGNAVLQASIFLLVMSMAAMGLLVDLQVIRRTGLKAIGVAALAFAIFVSMSALLIFVLGLA